MEITQYKDYRQYLRDELEQRLKKNPVYSLRAFAQHLKMTPQMLSYVLNEKKHISSAKAAQISDRLLMNQLQAEYFLDLVALNKAKNSTVKNFLRKKLKEVGIETAFYLIESEKFQAISDWHHYAILELVQTSNCISNYSWIAQRLGIKTFQAKQAIQRLKKFSLVSEGTDGTLRRTQNNITALSQSPSAALRKLARQYLEKAIGALETQTMDERDITNITMSIDPSLLPEAKKMIEKFRRDLCSFLEQGNRTEVYVFAPTLFKLTTTLKEEIL